MQSQELKNEKMMKKITKSHRRIDYFEKYSNSKGNKTPTIILNAFLFGFIITTKKEPMLCIHPLSQQCSNQRKKKIKVSFTMQRYHFQIFNEIVRFSIPLVCCLN